MIRDGRVYEATLTAIIRDGSEGILDVVAPAVGLWRGAPATGDLVTPGAEIGELEILSVLHRLCAPPKARGIVVDVAITAAARRAVSYGDVLLSLDPSAALGAAVESYEHGETFEDAALVVRAPSSGRFYSSPGPGKPPFVSAGDEIAMGHTLCMLEVMKTFNRILYGGPGYPERARVVRVVPENETDLAAGDIIVELEPV